MLTEKTNETGEGQETQSATPSGDPTPANPENPTQENQGQGTTPTSNESENNNQNGTPTNADPTDNILTADEQARKQELEQSSLKELNDKKAEMGREQKKWDTERQSLLDRTWRIRKSR